MYNTKHPKVSVIIPTYNCERYVLEAIESVLRQTFHDWELIVVDDGSTDKTSEVVKPYLLDKRVRYLFQQNRGLSAARNTGIKASSGEYLQFLDADDLIHTEKLEQQISYLENRQDVDVVFSNYYLFEDDKTDTLIKSPPRKLSGDIKTDMLRGNFIAVNSPLSKRKAIDAVGGFDETLNTTEDWDLWLRMLLSGKVFGRLDEKLAFVRIHPWRMTGKRLNMYSGRYLVIKKNLGNVSKSSIYWHSAKECFVRSKLAVMRENLYRRKFKDALRVILDKPHYLSFHGIMDFMIETVITVKRLHNRIETIYVNN